MRRSTMHLREQGAIGLVEAIAAAVILLIIATALSTVLLGSAKTQATMTLSERRLAAAEGLFERLKADGRWAGPSGADCYSMAAAQVEKRCSSAWLQAQYSRDGLVDQRDVEQALKYETQITITGIDAAADGQGVVNDNDGQRPDYYHAVVAVRPAGSTKEWTTIEGTIDPPGRQSTGTLAINICKVERQYDERIPIGSCPTEAEVLLGYPAGGIGPVLAGTATDRHATADWTAALSRAGTAGGVLGWKMVTYDVKPANGIAIVLTRTDGGMVFADGINTPSFCSLTSGGTRLVCSTIASSPIRRVGGLRPGNYAVDISNIPAGYEKWGLHSIPSGETAIVDAGRTSRVLQVVKPVDRAAYTVDLRSCDHSTVMSWGGGPCVENIQPYGFSGYLVPASSARAHWSFDSSKGWWSTGEESVGAGADSITFNRLTPGLYTGRVVTGAQSTVNLTWPASGNSTLPFMWINPVQDGLYTGDLPASGQPTYTRHWCDYDRRVAYLANPEPGASFGPDGGTYNHTHYEYDYHTHYGYDYHTHYEYDYKYDKNGKLIKRTLIRTWVHPHPWSWVHPHLIRTWVHPHTYYSASASCPRGGGGGGPPGPGSGGA